MTSLILAVIRIWQYTLSPDHGCGGIFFSRCRFFPSCSEYAHTAFSQYGLMHGFVASLRRIARCNPFSRGGYDPI